ncbi:MAG: hypothetical protein Q9159_006229 [Coniocarpon cinnabarinum]
MIRLLNAESWLAREVSQSYDEVIKLQTLDKTPYVIISHTWSEPEVKYDDIVAINEQKSSVPVSKAASAFRLGKACQRVLDYQGGDFKHLWLDTVCIDQRNPFEVSVAVNSMFEWYKNAEVCFAYLSDYPSAGIQCFSDSRWFSRGWTLQELVAPKNVMFFTKDWNVIGDKEALRNQIESRTRISRRFLSQRESISNASVSQRMSWASNRQTSEPEDVAYCLLGLFGVNMPLLYGEGAARAFRRLQEEIIKYNDDHSIFAWKFNKPTETPSGLLAASPDSFRSTGHYCHKPYQRDGPPFQLTNKGVPIELPLHRFQGSNLYLASLDCPVDETHYMAVFLEKLPGNELYFHRVRQHQFAKEHKDSRGNPTRIHVKSVDLI